MPLKRYLPWLVIACFLGLFFFCPLLHILWQAWDWKSLSDGLPQLGSLAGSTLWFTFYQAVLSTALTLLVGLPGAYIFAHFEFTGRKLLHSLTAVPFMLPTVVVAAGFNALLGPKGWVNLLLMQFLHLSNPPITFLHSLAAILLAHVFYNTTILLRVVGSTWSRLDPRLGQAARMLGANRMGSFWKVELRMLLPSILAASLLVFLFDFSSFGVIMLLGGPTFATLEVEIYIQGLQMLNLPVAAVLSVIQLVCTLVFSFVYTRLASRTQAGSLPSPHPLRKPRSAGERLFLGGMLTMMGLLFILPLLALPVRSLVRFDPGLGQGSLSTVGLTLDYYRELFINRQGSLFYVPPILALRNSLTYSILTLLISLVLGYPLAARLSKPGQLERLLDPLLMLPLGASAVTLGLGYIVSFNQPPVKFLASPWLVPMAHSAIALPFIIRSLQPALAAIPPGYRQAATMLGASPIQSWLKVEWPVIRRAVLAAGTFAFTISLGEFGATSILARPGYPTLPLAIFRFLSQPGAMNYGQAMAMSTILMLITTLSILVIEQVRVPGYDFL